MSDEQRYQKILRKYNIKDGLTLDEIRRILSKEMSKHHPDINKEVGEEEKFKEVNSDYLFIRELIKKYKGNYVYTVNDTKTSTNSGYNNTTNDNKNNSNNKTTDDKLEYEIEKFIIELKNPKEKYKYIYNISKHIDYVINEGINNIKTMDDLIKQKKLTYFIITYYKVLFFIQYYKEEYDNEEINKLSDEILNKINGLKSYSDEIYNIENEYYNRLNPIITKIKNEINKITNPVKQLIDKIRTYKHISDYNLDIKLINIKNKIESIRNIKKVDSILNECLSGIKKDFIGYLQNEINTTIDSYHYDSISQFLLKADDIKSFADLSSVMNDCNNYILSYIEKIKNDIKNDINKFILDNQIEALDRASLDFIISNLNYIENKKDAVSLQKDVEKEKFSILKNKFQKRITNDMIKSPSMRFTDYNMKLYNIKTVEELNDLINEYENNLENQNNVNKKMSESLDEAKIEFIELLNKLKLEYINNHFRYNIDSCKKRVEMCNNYDDFKKIKSDFQIELLNQEKNEFYQELMEESLNNINLYSLISDYSARIYKITTSKELQELKEEYYRKRDILLNQEQTEIKSSK